MTHIEQIVNAMSVDVEDYFQVSAFERYINRESWASIPGRIEKNLDQVLELFAAKNARATFFTLGCVAEKYPSIIRKIIDADHELASHGWEHVRANTQTRQQFREDVSRTRKFLEDLSGAPVKGYRAASYSISSENIWALDELAEAGYEYSSSIAPIKHDHYGMSNAPRFPFKVANGRMIEIPVSTVNIAGKNIHCSGGGWFRLFPYAFSSWSLNRINIKELQPFIFYFHPWEVDPDQPRIADVDLKTKFRHYLNLGKMKQRMGRLLDDFKWGRVDEVFLCKEHPVHQQVKAIEWADYGIKNP